MMRPVVLAVLGVAAALLASCLSAGPPSARSCIEDVERHLPLGASRPVKTAQEVKERTIRLTLKAGGPAFEAACEGGRLTINDVLVSRGDIFLPESGAFAEGDRLALERRRRLTPVRDEYARGEWRQWHALGAPDGAPTAGVEGYCQTRPSRQDTSRHLWHCLAGERVSVFVADGIGTVLPLRGLPEGIASPPAVDEAPPLVFSRQTAEEAAPSSTKEPADKTAKPDSEPTETDAE